MGAAGPLGRGVLGIERGRKNLPRAEDCRIRHAEMFLNVAEVIPVVGIVPVVERKDHAVAHVALFHASSGVHRDGCFLPHADAAQHVPGHMLRMADLRRDLPI